MRFGDFELTAIKESTFKLDGGAMFGVVPKSLWSKQCQVDGMNRVPLSCNLLLIRTGSKNVLIETGMGNRWSDKERERFELRSLVDSANALKEVGLKNEDIDYVIISHLHFDHVGGAVLNVGGALCPAFPNARHIIQRGEWEAAHKANARARASYREDDFEPLAKAGLVDFVDGNCEILPGIEVKVSGGHTSHHQIVCFKSQGQTGVYFADIVPTRAHIQPPWVMGYDHFPLASCDVKSEYLSRAAREKWLVVFDHEIETPWGHVLLRDDGKFDWQSLDSST